MADITEIEGKTRGIICEILCLEEKDFINTASFGDDLNADSLDQVELIMAMEEEFDIDIPDEDSEFITTVQDAIDYINNVLA